MKRSASTSSPVARTLRGRYAGIVLSSIVAAFVAIASACSNQAEGERCETQNNNDDCATDDGLICYPAAQLTNTSSDRCCPSDRSKAVNPVCKAVTGGSTDAAPPADTGPAPSTDSGTKSDAADAADAANVSDAADAADSADQ